MKDVPAMTGDAPPRRLSNDPLHKDFHPSLGRVGLRIDGKERNDIRWYDADRLQFRTRDMKMEDAPAHALSIEPYWRFEESRQLRRRRERWEAKRGRG